MLSNKSIIERVEARLHKFIIDARCVDGCRCMKCFQRYLDGAAERSQELLVEALRAES